MKVEIIRKSAFLDISIGRRLVGRIVLELYDDLAPRATQNFLEFCTSTSEKRYQGLYFHRVVKNFVLQCGDWKNCKSSDKYPNEDAGSLNEQFEGEPFKDENLDEPLDEPFKLCMANNGKKDSNGSQFFITTLSAQHLNGKHTVFGKVIHGKSVVREMERVDTKNSLPLKDSIVVITKCGEWNEDMDVPIYNASYDPIGGDIYEEFPDDDTNIDKDSSESAFRAAEKIKDSGSLLLKKGDKKNALLKYLKSLRYTLEFLPDEDLDPQWSGPYTNLKFKLYLNLSLVYLQLGDFEKSIDYSTFVIDSPQTGSQDKAKSYYRRGNASVELKRLDNALSDFKKACSLAPNDSSIAKGLNLVQKKIDDRKQKEKASYAKFFK